VKKEEMEKMTNMSKMTKKLTIELKMWLNHVDFFNNLLTLHSVKIPKEPKMP